MKKICILSDTSKPHINGVVTTLENLVENLKNRKFNVRFINQNEFQTIRTPFYKELDFVINPWKIWKKIEEFSPDSIHIATEFSLGFFATIYCIKNNIKYTTSYHTNWPLYVKSLMPYFPENLVYEYLRYIHGNSCKILVTNHMMKKELENKGFKNLVVWSRGVDKKIFNSSLRKELNFKRPIFLNVGRVSYEKNLEEFLSLNLPGTKIIVGTGPLLEKYKRKYPDVIFLGKKEGRDLAEIYASSDVFVFPSKTDTFGMVLIESLACGLPVAAYPVTGPLEIIENGKNGYLSENLKEACLNCLNLMNKRKEIEEDCSKKWSWENTTNIFLENIVPCR